MWGRLRLMFTLALLCYVLGSLSNIMLCLMMSIAKDKGRLYFRFRVGRQVMGDLEVHIINSSGKSPLLSVFKIITFDVLNNANWNWHVYMKLELTRTPSDKIVWNCFPDVKIVNFKIDSLLEFLQLSYFGLKFVRFFTNCHVHIFYWPE